MLSPAVLLVFVLSPRAIEPSTPSFQSAAAEVLGPHAAVRVETLAQALPDAAALERGGTADGIVELIWSPTRESVLVHSYLASEGRWVDRTIRFEDDDLDVERGRLLGFAVASMFSDAPSFARASSAEPEATAPDAIASAATPEPPTPSGSLAPSSALAESRAVPVWSTTGTPAPAVPYSQSRSLEFAAVAVPDFAGSLGPELGASVALRSALADALWLRAELSARLGEVPTAQANLRRVLAGLGIAWDSTAAPSTIRVGLRADILGSWLQVAHLSSDDAERVHQQRWLLGSDALLTMGYGISTSAAIFAGVGVEAMFGRTYVDTHGEQVAVVPLLRSRLDLGFRSDF